MFFISILKYLRGYLLVHLTGFAPERFLNLCGKRNILLWNLKRTEEGYLFYISVDAYKSLRPILKKTKTKIKILEKKGLPFYLFRYRKRKVFAAGVLFFWMILIWVSGYLWNIEISGNSYLSDETILFFLEEEGAAFGTKLSEIDCAKLEESLRSDYPEVIWTSIKIYGTKMTVEVQESLLADEAYTEAPDEICDIVAAKDGVITDIITRQGTPKVTIGTEVKQGDCLVSGEIEIPSDYGDVLDYLYERADADILAQVQYQYSERISKKYQEKVFKEEKQNYILQIGDIIIKNPFFKAPEGLYDIIVEDVQFRFGENYYFPLFFKKIRYASYELEEKIYTETQLKELAEKHFFQYLENLKEKGIQIIGKNVMIKRVNQNTYLVYGTVDAKESIVDYRPTEIHEIKKVEEQVVNESD